MGYMDREGSGTPVPGGRQSGLRDHRLLAARGPAP